MFLNDVGHDRNSVKQNKYIYIISVIKYIYTYVKYEISGLNAIVYSLTFMCASLMLTVYN